MVSSAQSAPAPVLTRAPGLDVWQVPALDDNYVYLVHHVNSGTKLCVDPSEGEPVVAAIRDLGWQGVDLVLVTHWHPDHTAGIPAVKAMAPATVVVGPRGSNGLIQGVDVEVSGAAAAPAVALADGTTIRVLDVPGHTLDHIAFHFEGNGGCLFSGDAIFPMGCGRLFEGTAAQAHSSLATIAALPDDTQLFAAHEYSAANAAFAVTVDPANDALQQRAALVKALRGAGLPTVPSLLSEEIATNPFLRAHTVGVRDTLGMLSGDDSDADVFAEVRRRKDAFT